MIVCHCWGITDRDLRRLLKERGCSLGDVADAIPAGSDCGGCRSLVAAILAANERREESTPAPVLVDA